ncbi:MAG: FliH/SctL family protein, partial [Nitrospinaceae bacterium]
MDSFIPDTFTPTDAPSAPGVKGPAPGPGGEVEFQDFSPERRSDTESFAFDNEDQRNFDPGNVQKAREGVREVFQDAMSRLKTQAEEIKEQARREAHEQGYEAGFKAGREAAQGEFTPFLEMLQQLVEDLSHLRQQMFSKVEREMIQIIVGLAKRVIHHELNSREDSVREVIRLAVQSVLNRQQMTLKVHPDDKLHAESFRPELQQLFHEIQNITIEAQPAIQR